MDFHLDTLLNFPNVTVESCTQQSNEVHLKLRFLNEESPCPHCSQLSSELHQNRPIVLRDLSIFGQVTYLQVPRRQFYCRACQCYFTESLTFMEEGRHYTRRYEESIYQQVQLSSIEQVSRVEGLSSERIEGIFKHQYGLKKNERWENVTRIGIDEISKRKGHQNFVTVVGDLEVGKLIEVIDSHEQDDIIEVLKQQPIEVREKIEEVSVDMWGGFPKVVERVFPNAVIVIDRFHVMQAVNKELNQLRRQVGITDRRSKFLLLKNREDLTIEQKAKLGAILERSKRLRKAYEWKEEFRGIYEQNLSVEEGRNQILDWLSKAREVYGEVIATIHNHLDGISNYFRNRTTSGAMEGINNRIKLIKRQAYGFMNFKNFRERLLACFADKKKLSPC